MSRILRASGYVALTVQMVWGLVQVFAISPAGPGLPPVSVGAHAHFGMLSILAVVTGFAVERTALTGRLRSVAIWGFVVGQWLLPATILMEMGSTTPHHGVPVGGITHALDGDRRVGNDYR